MFAEFDQMIDAMANLAKLDVELEVIEATAIAYRKIGNYADAGREDYQYILGSEQWCADREELHTIKEIHYESLLG